MNYKKIIIGLALIIAEYYRKRPWNLCLFYNIFISIDNTPLLRI